MSTPLVVNGTTYNYPDNRESAGWGEEALSWAVAVTSALSTVSGTGDITPTSAVINNDTSSAFLDVVGLFFDPSTVRTAIVEFSVYRITTGGGATEKVQGGHMYATYMSLSGTWDLAIVGSNNSGVTFQMSNAGQIQYKCSAITGSGYIGTIKFRAHALTN